MGNRTIGKKNLPDKEQEKDELMKINENVFNSRAADASDSIETELLKAKKELEKLRKENEILMESRSVAESSRIENNEQAELEQIKSDDRNNGATCPIQFRDLENTIPKFDGSGPYRVESWIDDFERINKLYILSPLQCLSFAKQSLKGIAEKAAKSATQISSWQDLKAYLKAEFSRNISSADVHNQLRQRRKRREESLRDYLYDMRQLGSMGGVDDTSIISYIIDGIDDAPANKVLLYGACSMSEFREKLFIYEEFKSKQPKPSTSSGNNVPTSQKHHKSQHCFNCGKIGHLSKNCYKKSEGPRCFKCQQFGHKAPECSKKNENVSRSKSQGTGALGDKSCLANVGKSSNYCTVVLNSKKLEAVIDTGSDFTIIREDEFQKLGLEYKDTETEELKGIGNAKVKPLGTFISDLEIDGETFEAAIKVVESSMLPVKFLIGYDILKQAIIYTENGKINVRKYNKEEFPFNCLLVETEDEIDVGEKQFYKEVIELVNGYEPLKVKECPFSLKIVLRSEVPVWQPPRRLSWQKR